MKCRYCSAPLPVASLTFAHDCPEFPAAPPAEGEEARPSWRVMDSREAGDAIPLLVALAESVARIFPAPGSTWGDQARKALAAAREEGIVDG